MKSLTNGWNANRFKNLRRKHFRSFVICPLNFEEMTCCADGRAIIVFSLRMEKIPTQVHSECRACPGTNGSGGSASRAFRSRNSISREAADSCFCRSRVWTPSIGEYRVVAVPEWMINP